MSSAATQFPQRSYSQTEGLGGLVWADTDLGRVPDRGLPDTRGAGIGLLSLQNLDLFAVEGLLPHVGLGLSQEQIELFLGHVSFLSVSLVSWIVMLSALVLLG